MPQILRYAGLVEESEYNPETVPAAAFHVDLASSTLDSPSDSEIEYEGGIGRGIRTKRPGWYQPDGNLQYAFDVRTIGWLLKWVLGGYHFTDGGAEDHNMHELYGTHSYVLPSFTARLGKDVFEHAFTGCVANSLQIQVSDGLAQATLEIEAAKDHNETLKSVSDLILPDEHPIAFHEVTAEIAASDVSVKVREVEFNIGNNVDDTGGRSIGSRFPRRMPVQNREVTVSLDFWYEDIEELQRFWGATGGPSNTGSDEFELILKFDGGALGDLNITIPRAYYSEMDQQPSGRDFVTQTGQIRALLDDSVALEDASTVDTEVIVRLQNDENEMVLA